MYFRDEGILDTTTPTNDLLSAKYKRSFAYVTMRDRLPVIITRLIDCLSRDKEKIIEKWGEEVRGEIKDATAKLAALKNEIQTNKPFVPFTSNSPDIPLWNEFLDQQKEAESQELKWFGTVWLYAECYMYRRVREIFEIQNFLANFDYFSAFKQSSQEQGMKAFASLANYLISESYRTDLTADTVKTELIRLFKLNLWANKCDLSISEGIVSELGDNPIQLAESLEQNILVDDTKNIWNFLSSGKKKKIIDIVCDNAGYELFLDMCLADFLVAHSFAQIVRFRVKSFPWYVSDATENDFHDLVNVLSTMGNTYLAELGKRWQSYLESNAWTVQSSYFWTLPYAYKDMELRGREDYEKLKESDLVIFKGDLNYRKLVGERNWSSTEGFKTSLQNFLPTNIVALRTLKSEPISGLRPGLAVELALKDPKWNLTGDYGVIQFANV